MTELIRANKAVTKDGETVTISPKDVGTIPKEIAVMPQQTNLSVNSDIPEYMRGVDEDDAAAMAEYISPPFLRIVQAMTPNPFKREFGEMALYMSPAGILIQPAPASYDEAVPLRFVPVFFYKEFIEWNPREMKRKVRNRTVDTDSDLAKKCRSLDKKISQYPCPEMPDKQIKCFEHLNFIIILMDHELTGTPMILSFNSSSFPDGKQLIENINKRHAKMYGLIFEMQIGPRHDAQYEWHGLNIRSAITAEGMTACVNPEWFAYTQQLHEELKAKYSAGLLKADYEELKAKYSAGLLKAEYEESGENTATTVVAADQKKF